MTHKGVRIGDKPTFADILSPMSEANFFAEHYDRRIAHIEGGAEKFVNVMSWETLTSILNMTAVWSSRSLELVHEKNPVPPPQYCRPAKNRDGQAVLQPDSTKVMRLLRDGASLVANDIDTLTPALRGVAGALEAALFGKAQANLYCSWQEHQGFGTHFDTHDVYAVHVAGEKLWRIYETRANTPIAHPRFKSYGQDWHDAARGKIAREILMRPGDLLYIPRGQYHDAVATSNATIHVAFGVTHVIGMDAIDLFADMAVNDEVFRRNMPWPSDNETDAESWLVTLGERIASYARSPDAIAAMTRYQKEFRYPRAGIELPVSPRSPGYRLTAKGLRTEQRKGEWILKSAKGAVPIPKGLEGPVSWIVARAAFTHDELTEAFPEVARAEIDSLLSDLQGMKVVAGNA